MRKKILFLFILSFHIFIIIFYCLMYVYIFLCVYQKLNSSWLYRFFERIARLFFSARGVYFFTIFTCHF